MKFNNINVYDEELLKNIVNHNMVYSSTVSDIGLFNGKMGMVVFFHHYSYYSKNKLYADFANELMDEIYDDISTDMSIDLESGLSGIGWGMEYLFANKFVYGDTDSVLSDLDVKIMEYDPFRIIDMSLKTGLEGIVNYVMSRIFSHRSKDLIPFDKRYLKMLYQYCEVIPLSDRAKAINNYIGYITGIINSYSFKDVIDEIVLLNLPVDNLLSWQNGLKKII